MPDVIRVNDATTRAEYAETLGHLCAHAKRQQHVIETFQGDVPTAWTKAHRRINAVLDDYEQAPAWPIRRTHQGTSSTPDRRTSRP